MKKIEHYLEYLISGMTLESYPVEWHNHFRQKAPLAVEIGFGNGEFLLDWACKTPEQNFIGIELSMQATEKLCIRLAQKELTNVRVIRNDARFILRKLFADNSVQYVVMNFPDPWPKGRHRHRRLLDADFIELLAGKLNIQGIYELMTDQAWYADQAYQLFTDSPYFKVFDIETNPSRNVVTKYERKWQEIGRDSYRVMAQKTDHHPTRRLLEDTAMPHSFIEGPVSIVDIESLIGLEYMESDCTFIVKEAFSLLDKDKAQFLIRLITRDGNYQQNFYALIKYQAKMKWLIKLAPTCQPYRTPAVKLAISKIGEMLNAAKSTPIRVPFN